MSENISVRKSLLFGVLQRCPKCGRGRLFKSYLQREDACSECGESFVGLDADDGPAWLSIGMTAVVIVPLLIYLEHSKSLPDWLELAVLLLTTIACALVFLPRSKGFFIAALWLIARQ